jgi:ribosomal protein S18 acetylase RimI-like enzyme
MDEVIKLSLREEKLPPSEIGSIIEASEPEFPKQLERAFSVWREKWGKVRLAASQARALSGREYRSIEVADYMREVGAQYYMHPSEASWSFLVTFEDIYHSSISQMFEGEEGGLVAKWLNSTFPHPLFAETKQSAKLNFQPCPEFSRKGGLTLLLVITDQRKLHGDDRFIVEEGLPRPLQGSDLIEDYVHALSDKMAVLLTYGPKAYEMFYPASILGAPVLNRFQDLWDQVLNYREWKLLGQLPGEIEEINKRWFAGDRDRRLVARREELARQIPIALRLLFSDRMLDAFDVEVREGNVDDCPGIALVETFAGFPLKEPPYVPDFFRKKLEEGEKALVAVEGVPRFMDGESAGLEGPIIVGDLIYAPFIPEGVGSKLKIGESFAWYLDYLSVSRCKQRHGIATQLMEEVEKRAREKGVKALYLRVYERNPAVRLYSALGFAQVGRDKNCYGRRLHGIFMKKELASSI